MSRIYADYNATTPLLPEAQAAMAQALSVYGNPASIHAEGRAARRIVEQAREHLAALIEADPLDLILTSGGSESNWLAICGFHALACKQGKRCALTSRAEHPSLLQTFDFFGDNTAYVAVDSYGQIDFADLSDRLTGGDISVVAITLANHETGVVQKVSDLALLARQHGAYVHCDAVAAAGKMSIAAVKLGVDSLAFAPHKFGGPKGVGCVWIRRPLLPEPLFSGSGQERGLRPGTPDVVALAGAGAAAQRAQVVAKDFFANVSPKLELLRTTLMREIPALRIHGPAVASHIGNTLNVAIPGVPGATLVQRLDLAGVSASTGAACSSGSSQPSNVLLAMGYSSSQAKEAVRFSLGENVTENEVLRIAELTIAAAHSMQKVFVG